KFEFPYFHTHIVMLFFITKTSRHPATARRNYSWSVIFGKVQNIKSYFLVGQGFLVAMGMYFYLFFLGSELCRRNVSLLNFDSQKFLNQKCAFRNVFSNNFIVRQTQIFISKRKDCRGFNTY